MELRLLIQENAFKPFAGAYGRSSMTRGSYLPLLLQLPSMSLTLMDAPLDVCEEA